MEKKIYNSPKSVFVELEVGTLLTDTSTEPEDGGSVGGETSGPAMSKGIFDADWD